MKPGPWWRAQNNCVDSDKLKLLGDKAFRNWFNLVCVASTHKGALPDIKRVAVKLGVSPQRAAAAVAELVAAGLFEQREDGVFVPHDWNEYQYKVDTVDPTAAERQRRKREKDKRERDELLALRHMVRNGVSHAVSHGVTAVMASRAEEGRKINTSTEYVERGLSEGIVSKRPDQVSGSELAAIYAKRGAG